MTTATRDADEALARRVLNATNMAAAVIGGLSLAVVVATPFNMAMTTVQSFASVFVTAVITGGFPLVCVGSVVLSRRWLAQGRSAAAVAIAAVPSLFFLGLVTWIMMMG